MLYVWQHAQWNLVYLFNKKYLKGIKTNLTIFGEWHMAFIHIYVASDGVVHSEFLEKA